MGVRIPPPLPAPAGRPCAIGATRPEFPVEEVLWRRIKSSRRRPPVGRRRSRIISTSFSSEMKRVTWPPWKQVRATTVVVIVAVFAFAAYFLVVDAVVDAGDHRRSFNTFYEVTRGMPKPLCPKRCFPRKQLRDGRRSRSQPEAAPNATGRRCPAEIRTEALVHHPHLLGLRAEGGGFAAQPRRGVRVRAIRSGRC